jgi:hypothetical protein
MTNDQLVGKRERLRVELLATGAAPHATPGVAGRIDPIRNELARSSGHLVAIESPDESSRELPAIRSD